MKKIDLILLKCGEISLKGLNRPKFEQKLADNVAAALGSLGRFSIKKSQSMLYVEPLESGIDMQEAVERLKKVFGIANICPAVRCEKDMESIKNTAVECMKNIDCAGRTFKVESKREDKKFPLNSPQISREVGGAILKNVSGLKVDVHNPDILVQVEVRGEAYIFAEKFSGAGGMPVGSSGRAALLLSGGIDSPVAGWMIAKRGVKLDAVYFHSPPYTSERAKDKVVDLAKIVSRYSGPIKLHLVPFTEIQLAIYEKCPPKETTVLMRRLMMKIAQLWAEKDGARALITGEALGQVASQTLESLCVTDDAVTMPVFRPLIGFDKNDIVAIAKKIDTFNTSILPYEDCCTVFVPQHPVTKPEVQKMRESEALVDFSEMIQRAIENTETVTAI